MMTPTGDVEKHMLRGAMTRRYFVSCLGGTAVTWPRTVRAQHVDGMRYTGRSSRPNAFVGVESELTQGNIC